MKLLSFSSFVVCWINSLCFSWFYSDFIYGGGFTLTLHATAVLITGGLTALLPTRFVSMKLLKYKNGGGAYIGYQVMTVCFLLRVLLQGESHASWSCQVYKLSKVLAVLKASPLHNYQVSLCRGSVDSISALVQLHQA